MFPFCHLGSFSSIGSWGAWGWGGMILGSILWIALIIGLVLLAVWLFRRSGAPTATASTGVTAIALLKERYAKGDISREDYQRTLEDLR